MIFSPGGCTVGEHFRQALQSLLALLVCLSVGSNAQADTFTESPPAWERLLWGGPVAVDGASSDQNQSEPSPLPAMAHAPHVGGSTAARDSFSSVTRRGTKTEFSPNCSSGLKPAALAITAPDFPRNYTRYPFRELSIKNIAPLYTSPPLPGEGIWEWRGLPGNDKGSPIMYRTSYRPSVTYPNAIVHMLLFDMKRIAMRLHLGSGEPGAPAGASRIDPGSRPNLLAITNALWKQKHSGGAGAIFRGGVVRKLVPGMATLVVYKDESVDVLEWNDSIPADMILDARQLQHLIVKDGKVVETVVKGGQRVDSEIGLGFLLAEDQLPSYGPWGGYYGGPFFGSPSQTTYGPEWFIATRSAFGIRKDGNLVFAMGHHISTKDLARALVLAGCERAIHGDANPHNVLGNLYFTDEKGAIVKREKLSPEQREDTLRRYVDQSYTSDFFVFLRRPEGRES
ncbi:MAG: phosphodiester glycosidase family protein [Desulfomonile sp.]|nr:phosphodiester glycosidase family protein [Desulfomonile sp.]